MLRVVGEIGCGIEGSFVLVSLINLLLFHKYKLAAISCQGVIEVIKYCQDLGELTVTIVYIRKVTKPATSCHVDSILVNTVDSGIARILVERGTHILANLKADAVVHAFPIEKIPSKCFKLMGIFIRLTVLPRSVLTVGSGFVTPVEEQYLSVGFWHFASAVLAPHEVIDPSMNHNHGYCAFYSLSQVEVMLTQLIRNLLSN